MLILLLYEERENSQYCSIKSAWKCKKDAITQMHGLTKTNRLYSEHRTVNLEGGYAERDPMYNEKHYSHYY